MGCYIITDPDILKNLGMRDLREAFVSVTSPTAFGCEEEIEAFVNKHANNLESASFSEVLQHVQPEGQCWYAAGRVVFRLKAVA